MREKQKKEIIKCFEKQGYLALAIRNQLMRCEQISQAYHSEEVMNTITKRLLVITLIIVAALVFLGGPAQAQYPPAQGPAQPSQNASKLETSEYTFLLGAIVKNAIATENKKLPIGSLSWAADTPSPYIIQTLNQDRPNEFYVDIPELLTYTYSVGVSLLNFTQSADFSVSCEGWQTGSGTLTVSVNVQAAQFDPDQVPAQVLPVIQSLLQSVSSGTSTIRAGQACSSLGLSSTTKSGQADWRILYDTPVKRLRPPTGQLGVTVRVLKVKRLANGGHYEAMETPQLTLWAFYSSLQLELPAMTEGQTYVPATSAVVETPVPSANGELVVIASMTYSDLQNEDSTFAVFGHSSNFGSGNQTLVTPKKYPIPNPNPAATNKPIIATANGYQVALQIVAPPTSARPSNPAPAKPASPRTTAAPHPVAPQ